jgi:hypothetical protein
MPAAIKRRKVSATAAKTSLSSRPRGLDAFTRVSKATNTTKEIIDKDNYVNSITIAQFQRYPRNERKRKPEDEEERAADHDSTIFSTVQHRNIKPSPRKLPNDSQRIPQTPQKPVTSLESLESDETPTKGARSLLDRLFLSSKTPTRSPLSSNSSNTFLLTQIINSEELPTELLDLINLHAAFLTALSLHYAHNGTHAPADLRNICPDVARAWGKRAVTLEDIRRTLGVLNKYIPEGNKDHKISHLTLSDYGHGKICIEMKIGLGRPGRIARPVNENLLNEIYRCGLKKDWEERPADNIDVQQFVESLPLEPITTCSSLIKMSPLLAKGQRRLEDLRAVIMVKKEPAKGNIPGLETTNAAKSTLLERLRAKQLHQSSLPPLPSKAELGRKAALQRIEEVVAVLAILSTSSSIGQQRISFTLPTVLGKLRDSFKTPMSKEEGDTCVRLLASEIAPEWVRLVKMGKVEALVVNRDERPSELDIKQRVRDAT